MLLFEINYVEFLGFLFKSIMFDLVFKFGKVISVQVVFFYKIDFRQRIRDEQGKNRKKRKRFYKMKLLQK